VSEHGHKFITDGERLHRKQERGNGKRLNGAGIGEPGAGKRKQLNGERASGSRERLYRKRVTGKRK